MSENKEVTKIENIEVGFATMRGFEALTRQASTIAQATMIPAAYQKNPANCLIALNMANRMNADPLMVMQNLYTVHGNPSWSSKFLIATFNTCGRYTSIRYEKTGEKGKDSWGCRAWAVEKETGEKLIGAEITIDMAKKEGWYDKTGSKWKTLPELMLQYRAAAFFIRAYAPELSVGLMTTEEVIDMEQVEDGSYEAVKNTVNINQAAQDIDVTVVEKEKKKEAKATTEKKTATQKTEILDEELPF